MAIAVIGWGSLVWAPGDLPVQLPWQVDGPRLSVEFARKSRDGRITLVLVDRDVAAPVPTLWAFLRVASLLEARTTLSAREGCLESDIGYLSERRTSHEGANENAIAEWAREHTIAAVRRQLELRGTQV